MNHYISITNARKLIVHEKLPHSLKVTVSREMGHLLEIWGNKLDHENGPAHQQMYDVSKHLDINPAVIRKKIKQTIYKCTSSYRYCIH